ncbi:MAG: hypothetical protein KKC99_01130, partial [Proteobacteria bacterium]|nr:hypothetical protein [Pseudomonadota bacterium]
MNSPLDAFRAQLEEVGLAPVEIIADGQLHRCATVAKPRSVNAAYIAHLDEPPSLWWLDWATGQEGTWTAKEERILSPAERQALQARIEADRRARQEDENKRHAKAADKARRILAEAKECTAHPYLDRKGVKP